MQALNTISPWASSSNQSNINDIFLNGCLKVMKAWWSVKEKLQMETYDIPNHHLIFKIRYHEKLKSTMR